MDTPSCTTRILQAFVDHLAKRPDAAAFDLDRFSALDPYGHVSVRSLDDAISPWLQQTGRQDLGVDVGRRMSIGSSTSLDFAVHSAATLREAVTVAQLYRRLYADVLYPALGTEGDAAELRLGLDAGTPRALSDFTMACWYGVHLRVLLDSSVPITCLFAHSAPAEPSVYRAAFGDAELVFDAPWYGFRFHQSAVDLPLASADPLLHAVHCQHLERLHARMSQNFAPRLRDLLDAELRRGRPTADALALRLRMSRRTLVRRLSAEGTTFRQQLDEVRHQRALYCLAMPSLSMDQISAMLGFSHAQAFHRAFKRWTGQSPAQYRTEALPKLPPELDDPFATKWEESRHRLQ